VQPREFDLIVGLLPKQQEVFIRGYMKITNETIYEAYSEDNQKKEKKRKEKRKKEPIINKSNLEKEER